VSKPSPQIASGDKAIFAIVVPVILSGRDITHEHQPSIGEIQAPFFQGDSPLRRVKTDVNQINVSR
jgi:hypothetical protein